ncbi:hypothetical protein GPALN_011215 [Globodera pallida]|nr:hypothetical protein GPALN_011215 [Globodera pallida]
MSERQSTDGVSELKKAEMFALKQEKRSKKGKDVRESKRSVRVYDRQRSNSIHRMGRKDVKLDINIKEYLAGCNVETSTELEEFKPYLNSHKFKMTCSKSFDEMAAAFVVLGPPGWLLCVTMEAKAQNNDKNEWLVDNTRCIQKALMNAVV